MVLEDLAATLDGALVRRGDGEYDRARAVWNGMIDQFPAAVARCTSTEDVRQSVMAARSAGLALAIRGGGHSVAGFGTVDNGLVIDLSPMSEVRVDPATRRVRAGGGATLGDLDAAAQAHGLVVPSGVVSKTGIAGLTLNGGIGWLRRRWALSCDNLVGATLVTATGEVLEVSEETESDVLWGLRGGGGNFGVVTEFVFDSYPLGPEVAFVYTLYPLESARAVLAEHEQIVEDAGDDISSIVLLGHVPPVDDFPAQIHTEPFVGVLAVHCGPVNVGEQVLAPLRQLGEPLADLSAPMPFVEVQRVLDLDYPDGHHYYWKSANLPALSDDVVDILLTQAAAAPSAESTVDIWLNGGAIDRVSDSASTFNGRGYRYLIGVEANWEHAADDADNIAWTRNLLAELEPCTAGGAYLNFPGLLEEGDALVRASHGSNYPRLQALKQRLDPDNVFRRNANIQPAT